MATVFALPGKLTVAGCCIVFFVCFRESLETSIIVSVLLAFLKQTLGPEQDDAIRKKLVKQIWYGVSLGVLICLFIGSGLIAAFYIAGKKAFDAAEYIWEGVFSIVASIIITMMGAALLRVNKLQDKWKAKITKVLEANDSSQSSFTGRLGKWCEKHALFLLPFVTVLREGIEAVLGSKLLEKEPLRLDPVQAHMTFEKVCGMSTPSNYGDGGDGGWGIFNSLFGWQNSATYGSVISYNVYWLVVIIGFVCLRFKEIRENEQLQQAATGESVVSSDGDSITEPILRQSQETTASATSQEVSD
ncbi:high-affinity iron permease [Kalmusia sp. IMI 367209]|nr:high-affinity iron permease [Kalmusia sp. IMI 367209]